MGVFAKYILYAVYFHGEEECRYQCAHRVPQALFTRCDRLFVTCAAPARFCRSSLFWPGVASSVKTQICKRKPSSH